jgi:hypothetical protein
MTINHGFFGVTAAKVRVPEKSRFDNLLTSMDAGDTRKA